ncbi:MAG: secretin N-terminal domain-containing protein, partial [Chlamydiota bacterium]
MISKIAKLVFALVVLSFLFPAPIITEPLYFDLETPQNQEESVTVNFTDVSMIDFLRCVSEISEANFIYNPKIVDFKVSLFTGKETTPQNLLEMTLKLLKQEGVTAKCHDGSYYLAKKEEKPPSEPTKRAPSLVKKTPALATKPLKKPKRNYDGKFYTYSLQFRSGEEIRTAIQQMVAAMRDAEKFFPELLISIESMQYLSSTNSLLYSGTEQGITELTELIATLDVETPEEELSIDSGPIAMAEEFSNYPLPTAVDLLPPTFNLEQKKKNQFQVYKLQYHQGEEIRSAIRQMAGGLQQTDQLSTNLLSSISSMQWIEATNSLLYSGRADGIQELTQLIQALDKPKKQVFIEVLVIETELKNSLEFGLQWGSAGQYREKFRYGIGNFPASSNGKIAPLASALQKIGDRTANVNQGGPNGLSGANVPLGNGFSLGTIGDIILHKGKSYFSLATLVSALQTDGDSTIILNEKVIAQDNKTSAIFSGENIPFFGSSIEINPTSGGSQKTANIEYRDVGVKLDITPLIGEEDIITLKIEQNITSVIGMPQSQANTSGITTSKTDMDTQVHVPDRSFVVLSGMMRNQKMKAKSGIPCLGGLPVIGAAFSKTDREDLKRNIMIFVYPQIIHSDQVHQTITAKQHQKFKQQSADPKTIQAAINWLTEEKKKNDINSTIPGDKKSNPQSSLQSTGRL